MAATGMAHQVGCFRRWLIDEFGLDTLKSGSGILDVAGGKGELAFELQNLNRIQTTVIDPRPLDLTGYRRKLKYGIYWRNPLMHPYIDANCNSDSAPRNPQHLRIFLDDALMNAMPIAEEQEETKEEDEEEGGGRRKGKEEVWSEVFSESVRRVGSCLA